MHIKTPRPKILLVDDIPANLYALEHLLLPCNIEVFKANSGNEALKLALKHHFALILLDVQMPIMDGYETADFLIGDTLNKNIPIIFITAAYKDELHRLKGYRSGAIDYIEKPVDDYILLSKVNIFLKLYRQHQILLIQNRELEQGVQKRTLLISELNKFRHAVQQSPVSVIITDKTGKIEFINTAFEQTTGYTQAECLGKNPNMFQSGNMPSLVYNELWGTLLAGKTWKGELHNKKKNGDLFWEYVIISPVVGSDNQLNHYIAIKEDLTQRKQQEQEILKQNNYDPITDLPNRLLALDRLSHAIDIAESSNSTVTLFFVDIDNFKKINESYGRNFGNQLLIEVAARLSNHCQKNQTVACLGRDEFLLITPDLEKDIATEKFCEQLIACFNSSFIINSHEVFIALSIGISQSPADGIEPHSLIQNAEAAMVKAKLTAGNCYQFFTQHLNTESANKLKMETRLRRAIKSNLFQVFYQPLINNKTGSLEGAEALIRWTDEELGVVCPEHFIELAESKGLIDEIGEWVLTVAAKQAQEWKKKFNIPFYIAINFSAYQFFNADIKNRIEKILMQTGLSADSLEIEITERLLMLDNPDVLTRLNEINKLGIRLSIDDFGTGYSSLSYLKRFPVSTVKIDKSFINDICSDPEDAILTKTIITMSHSLNMHVIAEGVETKQQLDFLQQNGCDTVQGYLYSKPVNATDFEVFFSQKIKVISDKPS